MKVLAEMHRGWASAAIAPALKLPKLIYFIVLLVITGTLLGSTQAQKNETPLINREYPLKAIFLYNFATYIEWPNSTFSNEMAPFIIGEIGNSAVNETLQAIAKSKKVGTRKVESRQFTSVKEITDYQILFISRDVSPKEHLEIVEQLKDKHVLVVCESPGFAAKGASINFFIEENKIRFEINTDAVKKQGLKISSKLLIMAKIVTEGK